MPPASQLLCVTLGFHFLLPVAPSLPLAGPGTVSSGSKSEAFDVLVQQDALTSDPFSSLLPLWHDMAPNVSLSPRVDSLEAYVTWAVLTCVTGPLSHCWDTQLNCPRSRG